MKTKRLLFGLPLIVFLMLSACEEKSKQAILTINDEIIVYADGTEVPSNNPTIMGSLKEGEEISILPEAWMSYYNDLSDYLNVAKYYEVGVENTKPVSNTLSWTVTEDASYYVAFLSKSRNMTNPMTIFSLEKSVELKDLFAGTHYYYQIHAHYSDRTVISRKFDFKTVDFFRTLDIDGVQNARDIGNKNTADGQKKVKQGLVYRSAHLDSVTEKGKIQAKELYGIKTDLDLRGTGPTASPLGTGVAYVNNGAGGNYGSPYYTGNDGIQQEQYKPVMKANLALFADANNLPLLFHCAVGRDRTGTLAIMLYLILGVDLEQLKQDYIVYVFTSICNSDTVEYMTPAFNGLMNYINTYVGNDGVNSGTIYQRAEEYCLDIGLTSNELNAIRTNLLEDVTNE